ncbi:hypothetical protein ACW2QC_17585 [Virgibacillus sp. FSP13]
MVYGINPKKLSFFSILFLVLLWNMLKDYFGMSFSLILVVLLMAVGLGSIRFKLELNKDHFVYHMQFFQMSLFKKHVYPNQIVQLKFVRVGWNEKGAIIKVDKGCNIRLTILESQKAYEDLMDFAHDHEIPIFKTKDYLILEKMK